MFRRTIAIFPVLCLLLLNVKFAFASPAEPSDWLRNSGDQLEMRFHGEVLESSGQPAVDFTVNAFFRTKWKVEQVEPKIERNRFEVWVPLNALSVNGGWIQVTSNNGEQSAVKSFAANDFRQAAIDGMKLVLQKATRIVTVNVVHEGKPVRDAIVKVQTLSGNERRARSDESGRALIRLIAEQKLSQFTVWTADRKIGGFSFNRKPTRDPELNEYTVEVAACRDFKLQFVNEGGTPVSNVPFQLQIATPENVNYIGLHDYSESKTGTNGAVTYEWMPEWESHKHVELLTDEWILDEGRELVGDINVIKLKKSKIHERKRIIGRLISSETDVAGFKIDAHSFQAEEENRSDVLSTFSNSDGSFEFKVLPNATYCFNALDSHWVSETIDLLPYDWAKQQVANPQLTVSKGQTLEIIADFGSQKLPVANLGVSLRRPYSYSWREDGRTRTGHSGPQWRVTTDALGRATTQVPPGKVEVSVYDPLWRVSENIQVEEGKLARINLHRQDDSEKTKVTGRLLLSDGLQTKLDQVSINIGSVDGEHDESLVVKVNADGEFTFSTFSSDVALLAYSEDAQVAGSMVAHDLKKPLVIQIRPTMTFHGQLLGDKGKPLNGTKVEALVELEGDDLFEDSKIYSKTYRAKSLAGRTDHQGKYSIAGVPQMTKIRVILKRSADTRSAETIDEVFLEPNESRPALVSNLGKEAAQPTKLTLPERIGKMQRDCGLCGFHLLVIASGTSEAAAKFSAEYLNNSELPNVSSFLQLAVSTEKLNVSPDNFAYYNKRKWPVVTGDKVFVCAIDAADKELGRMEFDSSDPQAADQASNFLAQWAPKKLDAEKKWQEAFEEAKRTNRKVWVRISQRYCGPCFMLARWLADCDELLAKDYVLLKVDDVRDENGKSVANRLTKGKHYGVPFHAIFNSDGEIVIDSAGPLGNIGHPGGFEGKKHLRKMLMASRKQLTDAEIDKMVESVKE